MTRIGRYGGAIVAAAAAAFILAGGHAAANGTSPDNGAAAADLGRSIAQEHCARCHSVGESDASPLPAAPPFREFAAKWPLDQLEEAFAEGIVTGHPDMPQFVFQPDEISALIVFLDALADRGGGK